ncbi:hypothetical protein PHAVU_004G022100 [Phaseolus vulgaris]|uniref:Uncharacterized protein n=1 Tax=Phaseolus vulgaris TaxID=3885 RepID=V7BZ40_PHAVU|nr:hypothetical protein PHAVU_004G022100g [Phaseolus vulgaris]ESW23144.1 hypothetical protein PHAVU_004G022100g [Phaseolus vulgaris]
MEEMKVSRRVKWWQNMMYPVRRVWFSVATRLRIRKNGLLKLRHDVRACEYEDIQVMWEMLNRNESEFGNSSKKSNKNNTNKKNKGQCWKLLKWARCAPYYYMCRA